MRILVIEDERKLAHYLQKGLREHNYVVDVSLDGTDGRLAALENSYDLIVLDVMLPGIDGFGILSDLRRVKDTPVLMLTARDKVEDRVRGLEGGADDYLVKPFAFSELLARVQALIRRATSSPETTRLVAGDVTLDLVTREVTCAGNRVDLQPREFSLLAFLLRHAGRPVSKTMILEHVWDYSFDPQTNVVDVVMSRLRAKLDPDHKRIETVRGVGYIFRPHGHA